MPDNSPTLSVCCIARNEERRLPRLLESVREAAFEILVCDTGSEDGTVAVAEQYGARVFYRPWDNDFATPLNLLFAEAKGDWILRLDADEWLPAESLPALKQALTREDTFAYWTPRRDLADTGGYTTMWTERLYRNHPDVRLRRRVHPQFHPPLIELATREGKKIRRSEIYFDHDGYLNAHLPDKLARAARLLALALEEDPGDLYCVVEYGRTLLHLHDPKGHEVLKQATTALAAQRYQPSTTVPGADLLLEYLLVFPEGIKGTNLRDRDLADLCERWYPNSPPLLWHRAKKAWEAQEFARAVKLLERIVRIGSEESYNRSVSFDPRLMGDEARLNLAACYVRLGEIKKAERQFTALLDRPTVADAARANLNALRSLSKH